MKKIIAILMTATAAFAVFLPAASGQEPVIEPDGTYLYAQKDGCDLFLDYYSPARGSIREYSGREKPTVLFIFGGGFKEGTRNAPEYGPWFRELTANGYPVISIDYRLGLKDVKNVSVTNFEPLENAIHLAVSDLFSATQFIIENASELGIDPSNIVVSGSSAGAITALQGEWELCNRSERAGILPEDFDYAGVMSFAGAIFSRNGAPSYKRAPCPTMMLHGTDDKVVTYNQISLFRIHFTGSCKLSATYAKNGYNYNILRFRGNSHEIASSMLENLHEEIRFLEANVIKGENRIVDATIADPAIAIPEWAKGLKGEDLYK